MNSVLRQHFKAERLLTEAVFDLRSHLETKIFSNAAGNKKYMTIIDFFIALFLQVKYYIGVR
ncbi:MAG: hypothetical protein E7518_03030 [Ruminococcaceae bacterium]|nr:hypothetical protein [Oscillospiraceae bacterium]